ncbi:hypothetical protein HN992_03980 [Candidatus Woesearchaeota archaeon]|jgi:predicted membrane channel-forming protein YqfA (hemolysin III family)|nr:hypothetical protein [Candidatus Woesearchaeota archaeon]MBT4058659.1 hypothetical protein [Candidatus Woesearchaeota archaeon]MBT4207740.1 hypothetical protein [Candidatus Woesearchaeota archaeon]MBT4730986.1 hypothetical protein [Candidatus Woesearchaeota archaeon]MBT4783669.1 hypothetical protein [Candidatus Woesearchaeota archaeon]
MEFFMNHDTLRIFTLLAMILSLMATSFFINLAFIDKKKRCSVMFAIAFTFLSISLILEVMNIFHVVYTGSLARLVLIASLACIIFCSSCLNEECADDRCKAKKRSKKAKKRSRKK